MHVFRTTLACVSRYTCDVLSAAPGRLHDDSEIDLPPVDGADDETPSEEADTDGLDPVPADRAKDVFDDETGEDDPVEDDALDPVDEGALEDDAATDRRRELEPDFDEMPDFVGDREASLLTENDEPGVGGEDFDLREDESSTTLDAGEEGPGGADEELREEDLPALDADDLGEGDEDAFYELEGEAAPPFPWEDDRWTVRGLPNVPAATAVVSIASGALAIAGDPPKLWGIAEGGVESSDAEGAPREGWRSLRLARRTGELLIDTDLGLYISRDGGRHFTKREEPGSIPPRSSTVRDMAREVAARGIDLRGLEVGAAVAIDEAGTLLAAVSRRADPSHRTWLVRVPGPNDGAAPRTLAVVRGVVWDLSWDEPRGRVWVASDEGVTIVARPDSPAT